MCELFAMSARAPSGLTYSLDEFAKHGGLMHRNTSGWGIAYFEDREAFLVKEPRAASRSPLVRFIAGQERTTRCAIAHVRLATVGAPTLMNTHPFRRTLGGRVHVFAHNGTLEGLHDDHGDRALADRPVGHTDSELAFCLLLDRMRPLWSDNGGTPPPTADRLAVFAEFASDMRWRGSANFLYGDGEVLFAHAHKRVYEENGGFSEPRPPGLSIKDCMASQQGPEFACDGLKVNLGDRRTVLLASVPLDDRGWEPLPEGTALAICAGKEVSRVPT